VKRRRSARPIAESGRRTDTDWAFHADDAAVFDALAQGHHADNLREYFGTRAYAELSVLAATAKKAKRRTGPRVLILPGIMGSRLGTPKSLAARREGRSGVLWVNPLQIAAGRLRELSLPAGSPIQPVGVLLFSYAKLKLKLQIDGWDASFFAYDWRLGIDQLGAALARRILAEREAVSLIAHSMGGLIARVAVGQLPKRRVRKLIMMGTPNAGSFASVQALRGTYPFVRRISRLDRKHSADHLAAEVFRTFPGIYHMLPPRRGKKTIDLLDPRCWPANGSAPRADLLAQVNAARARLAPPDSRMSHIIGVSQETVVAVRRSAAGFEYDMSLNGDGTVPLDRARMKDLNAYFVEEAHGNLPNNPRVIQCVIDLLRRGRTRELPRRWGVKRGRLTRTDDALLRRTDNGKIDWRSLNAAQREAALSVLDDGRLLPYQV
jgi:pimeloyl-ACP methyl ester carboxylesterase